MGDTSIEPARDFTQQVFPAHSADRAPKTQGVRAGAHGFLSPGGANPAPYAKTLTRKPFRLEGPAKRSMRQYATLRGAKGVSAPRDTP